MHQAFPKLTQFNHHVTSPVDQRYNCIAWAAGDDSKWWWPDAMYLSYWPAGAPREATVHAFVIAYGLLGYEITGNLDYEPDKEKIAIYTDANNIPTHAARLIGDGKWTSKLGRGNDISHTYDALDGPTYGQIAVVMERRPKAS